MTGGNVINRPKTSLQKNLERQRRIKKAQMKKQKGTGRFKRKQVDELTTKHVLNKTRTNPKANISLSGKKKRLILKELKRKQKEELQMEVEVEQSKKKIVKESNKKVAAQQMDVE